MESGGRREAGCRARVRILVLKRQFGPRSTSKTLLGDIVVQKIPGKRCGRRDTLRRTSKLSMMASKSRHTHTSTKTRCSTGRGCCRHAGRVQGRA